MGNAGLMYVSLAVISGKYPVRPGKMKCVRVATADEHLKEVLTEDTSLSEKIRKCHVYFPDDRTNRNNGDKMNMCNINVITARSVPDKSVSDDFMNAVLGNCTTRIVLPAPKKFDYESLSHNFNMAAVGVMKKGMSMNLFSSPGNTVVFGQPCAGKQI